MKVYIAASWKHQHCVELLTRELRAREIEVLSFVENNHGELRGHKAAEDGKPMPLDEWVWSDRGEKSFRYDVTGAMTADVVVYIGPSGLDAWAEVGAAYASKRIILGLEAKGEQVGLMRRMMTGWHANVVDLLCEIDDIHDRLKRAA